LFNQPPLLGRVFNQPGTMAKNINGNAMANEKPSIPTMGAIIFPLEAASINKVPTIGPVHENDTMASANAMKNIPMIPPRSACLSTLFAHELGKLMSNAPKNDAAKTTNIKKNITLNNTLVERALSASAPNIQQIGRAHV